MNWRLPSTARNLPSTYGRRERADSGARMIAGAARVVCRGLARVWAGLWGMGADQGCRGPRDSRALSVVATPQTYGEQQLRRSTGTRARTQFRLSWFLTRPLPEQHQVGSRIQLAPKTC